MKISILHRKFFLLLSLVLLIFSLSSMAMQNSYAASRTVSVSGGETTITYRDVQSLDPTSEPVISLDKKAYHNGDKAELNITDFNANLDVNEKDSTSALVNSQTIELNETDVNSHVFVGTFLVNGNIGIGYTPDPPESIRAQVTLGVQNPGDVIISDHKFDQNELENLPFTPVTHALNIELANGATLVNDTNAVVTISYANADFDLGDSSGLLQMYYKPGPDFGWSVITLSSDPDSNNQDDLTVTSDPQTAFFCCQVTTGQYVLGFETGTGGGGAGGLVRPGLVLNLLAGTLAGNSGIDTSPPSLVFGKPSTNQGFAGFLFGSAPEPDPLAPILPTQDSSINVPLQINDNRYFLTGYSNTIEPVQIETGSDVDLKLSFLDASAVTHVALHFVDKNSDEMSDTDPTITFDNGSVVKSDSDGVLGDQISFTSSSDGVHHIFDFAFSFDKPTNRHLMITAWDEKRNSGNTKVFNAFEVTGQTIPEETNHLYLQDLGQFIIIGDNASPVGSQTVQKQELGYDYPDTIGRAERHDVALYDTVDNEKIRANQVINEKFNLNSETFVANNEVKPFDISKRASELSWSFVGHKLRDFTKTPEENKELIKQLSWQEHLKAQKILDSLLVESKYHQ